MAVLPSLPERLLKLMDHSLDFMEILGADGVVQGISAAIKPLSGYDPQEFVGHQYTNVVHPDDQARAGEAFDRALHGRGPETVKLRYRTKGGAWRTILATTQSFLDDPAVHAVVVLTRDLSDQRDVEAALVLANARVADLAKRLMGAEEKQRRYIAAELHDDVQQILVGLRMSMAPSRRGARSEMSDELVGGWVHLLQTAIDHLHELTVGLRKPVIDDQGLPGAMRSYVEGLPLAPDQKIALQTDDKVGTLAPNVALACFRIVQEALANAVKHSGAKNLLVRLRGTSDRLTVSIRDDGVGFDVEHALALAAEAGSIGLLSMEERATLAGGRFEVRSSIGHGTRIRASFPIQAFPPDIRGRNPQQSATAGHQRDG